MKTKDKETNKIGFQVNNLKVIIAFIIGIILASSIAVFATISASSIDYTANKKVSEALDDLYTLANSQTQITNSTIISNFSISNSALSGLTTTISLSGTISTTDSSGVRGYLIIVNDEVKSATTTLPYNLKLDRNTTNTIKVRAVDKAGHSKLSTNSVSVTTPNYITQALEYPILTTTGMKNVKLANPDNANDYTYGLDLSYDCTASDALDKKAYDGDESTYVDTSSGKKVFYFGSIDVYYTSFKTNATSGHLFDRYGGGGYIAVGSESALYNGYYHPTYYGKNTTNWRDYKSAIGVRIYEIKYDTTIP